MESSGKLEGLLHLQEIDQEIEDRRSDLRRLEGEMVAEAEKLEELETRVREARADADEADQRLRRAQRSVQAGRAILSRLEGRADEIQNMRQHLAVRSELETARRNLRDAEEDAMDALRDAEETRAELKELEAELEARQEEYAARRRDTEARRAELQTEIAVRQDRKRNRETRLDGEALRLYEKVRGGRTDRTLAPLTADGVCGHCYTSVPLQRQADIRAGRKLAVCEGCGVILYAED